ncbi:MAG TPA: DUF4132 domain-containing protein [Verrucomicrobiae bacterium]|nr:DUF4132 domain-containing protein [Verrucomicrobiae bacterium]
MRQWRYLAAHKELLKHLLRSGLRFREEDIVLIVEALSRTRVHQYDWPTGSIVRVCQEYVSENGLSPRVRHALIGLQSRLAKLHTAENRRRSTSIDLLLGNTHLADLEPGDNWADAARSDFEKMDVATRRAWVKLVTHALSANSTKPTKKWLAGANVVLAETGAEEFKRRVLAWFPLVAETSERERSYHGWGPRQPLLDRNSSVLKGLIWLCVLIGDDSVAQAVGDVAVGCFKKIPGFGPRSPKVGNACVTALSLMEGMAPVAQLSRLQMKVKSRVAQNLIGKALDEAARRAGLSRGDLEELSVPTYGLDENSCLREEIGGVTAELQIVGSHDVTVRWIKSDGKSQASVPAEVKRDFPDDLKQLQRTCRDMEKMLPAQQARLERLLLRQRTWRLETWMERYLNHPLLANMARRLIWSFQYGERRSQAIWRDGKLVDSHGWPLDWLTPDVEVRLWHPVGFDAGTVLSWRNWLAEHEVTQPFKQAHREIYLLTDAEIATATYSNRFAGHILRQHQFSALCLQRGWKYHLQGNFDSHNVPTLELPQYDARVEFWVESIATEGATSDTGIFLYVSTDQVRFCNSGGESQSLTEVPAILFTEVMRDVDLFVGVCSIGNDPNWQDRGDIGQYGNYWRAYSFGELSASAATRREVLQQLIPRLKIADRCSFVDKFLVVRGDLRTYKIHLGSGNILMEPNDQYLCIVLDRKPPKERAGKVFLPFEGDALLSVILSKAFLLAADAEIKDRTILSQIQGR